VGSHALHVRGVGIMGTRMTSEALKMFSETREMLGGQSKKCSRTLQDKGFADALVHFPLCSSRLK